VATRLQAHFTDGVVFVSLAALSDPALVLTTVARALGLTEQGSQPVQGRLATFLRHKHLLLVIDNFEHVATAAPELAPLLAACASLRLLLTSRAPLRLQGEHRYAVPPLALPDLRHLPPLEALSQVPAVALFVWRAQAALQDFALTPTTAPAVAAICVRLDGLPLAIELAAAQLVVLPPAALLARLAQPLQVLTGGPQDLPARQQTLRATIAWSYSLLSEAEQALFRRLAVFAGGATLAAVEAVCIWGDAPGDPLAGTPVLEGVRRLVHLHLLRMGPAGEGYPEGEPRFTLLATIQEFGREQLALTAELVAVRRRHASYFLTLAETALPHLDRTEQIVWLERLEEELDNLRAAWGWCLACGQAGEQEAVEHGMLAAGHLYAFWTLRGHYHEAVDWLERFLAVPVAQAHTRGRAAALSCLSLYRGFGRGELSTAEAMLAESVAIAREASAQRELAYALICWGMMCALHRRPGTDDLARARAYLEEAAALCEEVGDEVSRARLARIWMYQGFVSLGVGELSTAEKSTTRGLEVMKEIGDRWGITTGLENLGDLALARGDLVGACALIEEALVYNRAIGNRFGVGCDLVQLGDTLRRIGDQAAAQLQYAHALSELHAAGHVWASHEALCGLAELAIEAGEPARALRLISVAQFLADGTGAQPTPSLRPRLEQVRTSAAQALSAEEQAAAWTAGQTMPIEQVIAEALRTGGTEQL
jgi:predicted ATPase